MTLEKNKLFVGNLDNRVKWFHLKEFFTQYGEVTYTKVVYDRESKRSRGFGFVVFATDDDAAKALEHAHNTIITTSEISFPERPIRLMYAEAPIPKEDHVSGDKIPAQPNELSHSTSSDDDEIPTEFAS